MLSVILNLVTIAFVAYFIFVYQPLLDKKAKQEGHATASEALRANLKDPNVVSRAYFTEPKSGSIGGFVGYVREEDELTSL
jgi:pyruvate/2-oxoglutarate dehydrogenase complex dihydrolipoamide dehydrogenase (E3) component